MESQLLENALARGTAEIQSVLKGVARENLRSGGTPSNNDRYRFYKKQSGLVEQPEKLASPPPTKSSQNQFEHFMKPQLVDV